MKVTVVGTVPELLQMWHWSVLCELIHVDFYNKSMVADTEVFTITEADLLRRGIINPSYHGAKNG